MTTMNKARHRLQLKLLYQQLFIIRNVIAKQSRYIRLSSSPIITRVFGKQENRTRSYLTRMCHDYWFACDNIISLSSGSLNQLNRTFSLQVKTCSHKFPFSTFISKHTSSKAQIHYSQTLIPLCLRADTFLSDDSAFPCTECTALTV